MERIYLILLIMQRKIPLDIIRHIIEYSVESKEHAITRVWMEAVEKNINGNITILSEKREQYIEITLFSGNNNRAFEFICENNDGRNVHSVYYWKYFKDYKKDVIANIMFHVISLVENKDIYMSHPINVLYGYNDYNYNYKKDLYLSILHDSIYKEFIGHFRREH